MAARPGFKAQLHRGLGRYQDGKVNGLHPVVRSNFFPAALGLRQSISDGIDSGRMMTKAAMTTADLEVLNLLPLGVEAGLPCADAVGPAEDRCRGYARCVGHSVGEEAGGAMRLPDTSS